MYQELGMEDMEVSSKYGSRGSSRASSPIALGSAGASSNGAITAKPVHCAAWRAHKKCPDRLSGNCKFYHDFIHEALDEDGMMGPFTGMSVVEKKH